MHFFQYRGNDLFAEDVPVAIACRAIRATPLYIYSYNTLVRHYQAYDDAYDTFPHIICYALKANTNGANPEAARKQGCGADIVSGGELYRALKGRHSCAEDRVCRRRQDG